MTAFLVRRALSSLVVIFGVVTVIFVLARLIGDPVALMTEPGMTAADVANLAEDLQYSGKGVTMVEERDLWDMPILFLLMIGMIGSEWAFRRKRGLV